VVDDAGRREPGLKPGQLAALIGGAVGLLSMWVLPWLLGPIGIILGFVAIKRGEPRAKWVILASVVAMGIGFVIESLPDEFVTS
jgi:hypothetical protein